MMHASNGCERAVTVRRVTKPYGDTQLLTASNASAQSTSRAAPPPISSIASWTSFRRSYEGHPAWDVDRPQPAFVRLAEQGRIHGSVLDVGCGTGANSLYLAARGHEVWGIDYVPAAIDRARARAWKLGLRVKFRTGDALKLQRLDRQFDTVIDSLVFHEFSDDERTRFVQGLRSTLRPGGSYHLLCFSENEPGNGGPRRVTQREISQAFAFGWSIASLRPARIDLRIDNQSAVGWLARIVRLPDGPAAASRLGEQRRRQSKDQIYTYEEAHNEGD